MKIWAISDFHLPGPLGKKMDIFGENWDNHTDKIQQAWRERVSEEDFVLLPGDLSWAMRLNEAEKDLKILENLPGRNKILIRGNHDYWWSSLNKLNKISAPELLFLHNNAFSIPPFAIAGTRGWDLPSDECDAEQNPDRERICLREANRLKRSVEHALSFSQSRLIIMMHFPPLYKDSEKTIFTDIIDDIEPEAVIYGHLHSEGITTKFEGMRGKTRYILTSADAIDFKPVLIAESE